METINIILTLVLSIKVAVVATLFALPVGFVIAYGMSYYSFRGKLILEIMINLPLALPPVAIGSLLLYLLHPDNFIGIPFSILNINILFTWKAAVIASMVVGFPLLVRAIRINMDQIDITLLHTARSLGARTIDVIISIVVPLARPGIIAGALMMFVRSVGEFGATIMIAGNIPGKTQTMSLAIYEYASIPNGEKTALLLSCVSLGLAILALILYDHLMKNVWKCGG